MTRKRKISIGIVIALMTVLTGTALALSSISFNTGTVASYDFGGFGPGFPIPATIQIQKFTLKPGETIPWHFHKGVSYVILSRGTLTEQHLVGPCQVRVGGIDGRQCLRRVPRSGAQRYQHWPR